MYCSTCYEQEYMQSGYIHVSQKLLVLCVYLLLCVNLQSMFLINNKFFLLHCPLNLRIPQSHRLLATPQQPAVGLKNYAYFL